MKRNKDKNFEMRIYELLGVRLFRKLAFFLRDSINTLFIFIVLCYKGIII